jgi:cytochrome b6-f complex iron-sulfur subunit
MNRRDVIQKVLLGGTVLVLVPSVLESCKKVTGDPVNQPPAPGTKINIDLSLADNATLNTTGGSKIVQNVLVINTGSNAFVALTSICTHQGCTVGYDSAATNIKCPCHGSVYALTGSVITGPAPSGLQSYPVSKSGNVLTISI